MSKETLDDQVKTIVEESAKEKRHGFGAVYRSATGSLVDILGTVDTLASAGHSLAQQAEVTAMMGLMESAKEFHDATVDGGMEAVLSTREMMKVLRAIR